MSVGAVVIAVVSADVSLGVIAFVSVILSKVRGWLELNSGCWYECWYKWAC